MKALFGLIVLLCYCSSAQACEWVWSSEGAQAHLDQGICQAKVVKGPSLLKVKLPKKITNKELIKFDLLLSRQTTLSAVEFRLGRGGDWKSFKSHQVGFFEDSQFNWILPEVWNPVNLSLNHFDKGELKAKSFDDFYIFIESAEEQSFEISVRNIRVEKKSRAKGFVSITVDDGYESVYIAAQKMNKLGMPGVAYLIKKGMDQKGSVTKKQACEMKAMGWALGFHHEVPFPELTSLEQVFKSEQPWLKTLCAQADEKHLAYPLGKQDLKIRSLVGKYFRSARLASGGLETLPPAEPMALRTVNVLSTTAPEELIKLAKQAVNQGDWVIFMFHYFKDEPESPLDYRWKNFDQLLKGLKPLSKSVKTVPQVMELVD